MLTRSVPKRLKLDVYSNTNTLTNNSSNSNTIVVAVAVIQQLPVFLLCQIVQWLRVDELDMDVGRVSKLFQRVAQAQLARRPPRELELFKHVTSGLCGLYVFATAPFEYKKGVNPGVQLYVAGHKMKKSNWNGDQLYLAKDFSARVEAAGANQLSCFYMKWREDPSLTIFHHRIHQWINEKDMVRKLTLTGPWTHQYIMSLKLPFTMPSDCSDASLPDSMRFRITWRHSYGWSDRASVDVRGSEGQSIRDIQRTCVDFLLWSIDCKLYVSS